MSPINLERDPRNCSWERRSTSLEMAGEVGSLVIPVVMTVVAKSCGVMAGWLVTVVGPVGSGRSRAAGGQNSS